MHKGAEVESTETSLILKWRDSEKLAKLGTVNSEAQKKPKYPMVQATQNMQ